MGGKGLAQQEVLGELAVIILIFTAQKASLSQANAKHKMCGITNTEPGILPRRHSVTKGQAMVAGLEFSVCTALDGNFLKKILDDCGAQCGENPGH